MSMTKCFRLPYLAGMVLLAVAGAASAQEDIRAELQRLRAEMDAERQAREADRREIDTLKARLAEAETSRELESSLEAMVNRIDAAQEGVNFVDRDSNPLTKNLVRLLIRGEARVRAEWSTNLFDLSDEFDDEGFSLNGRFNLGFEFFLNGNVSALLEVQSAGRFNNNTVTFSSFIDSNSNAAVGPVEDELDVMRLYQGWVQLSNLFGREFFIRAGRQELRYGNEMLLGSDDFYAGTVHDAVRVDYETDWLSLSFFYAQEGQTDDLIPVFAVTDLGDVSLYGVRHDPSHRSQDDDYMVGIYTTVTPCDFLSIDLYYMYFGGREGDVSSEIIPIGQDPTNPLGTGTTDLFLGRSFTRILQGDFHTVGLRLFGNLFEGDAFNYSFEFAWQGGDFSSAKRIVTGLGAFEFPYEGDVHGIALEGHLAYTFVDTSCRPRIYASALWTEGPDDDFVVEPFTGLPIANQVGFQPLFMSRHQTLSSRFGNADVFPLQGVILVKGGFEFMPWDNVTLGTTGIWGWFDEGGDFQDFTDVRGYGDDSIGFEWDLYLHWAYSHNCTISFNASLFFPDSNLDNPSTGFLFDDSDLSVLLYLQAQILF